MFQLNLETRDCFQFDGTWRPGNNHRHAFSDPSSFRADRNSRAIGSRCRTS